MYAHCYKFIYMPVMKGLQLAMAIVEALRHDHSDLDILSNIERMSGISITDLSLAAQRLVDAELLATFLLADE